MMADSSSDHHTKALAAQRISSMLSSAAVTTVQSKSTTPTTSQSALQTTSSKMIEEKRLIETAREQIQNFHLQEESSLFNQQPAIRMMMGPNGEGNLVTRSVSASSTGSTASGSSKSSSATTKKSKRHLREKRRGTGVGTDMLSEGAVGQTDSEDDIIDYFAPDAEQQEQLELITQRNTQYNEEEVVKVADSLSSFSTSMSSSSHAASEKMITSSSATESLSSSSIQSAQTQSVQMISSAISRSQQQEQLMSSMSTTSNSIQSSTIQSESMTTSNTSTTTTSAASETIAHEFVDNSTKAVSQLNQNYIMPPPSLSNQPLPQTQVPLVVGGRPRSPAMRCHSEGEPSYQELKRACDQLRAQLRIKEAYIEHLEERITCLEAELVQYRGSRESEF